MAAASLGPGLALEDALRARQPVLFSLDAATYPEFATNIGAWVLLDLVRVAALRPGPSLVIIDEFAALGREGRHVVPLLARSRESDMACVLATHGLSDLARVDRDLPQQITQNTAVRLVLCQGSAEDQEACSALLGGAAVAFNKSAYVHRERARAVAADELAMLRTGEAFLQVLPGASDGSRQRLWIARPRKIGDSGTALRTPEAERRPVAELHWSGLATHKRGDAQAIWIDTAPRRSLAYNRAGPADTWGSPALGTADDAADRALVLHQSANRDQPDQGAAGHGREVESGMKPRTVQYLHGILRAALNRAVKWQVVPRNVALLVDPPLSVRHGVTPDRVPSHMHKLKGVQLNREPHPDCGCAAPASASQLRCAESSAPLVPRSVTALSGDCRPRSPYGLV